MKYDSSNSLNVHEIFASIQGESTEAGKPVVFIRLFGCNMTCKYCDQPQEKKDRKKMTLRNIVAEVQRYMIPNVCITGGEPLLQFDGVYQLALEFKSMGYNVAIETNGCTKIESDSIRKFKYVMDVKCPSSGVAHHNILSNIMHLQKQDEIKFVIADERDYKFAKKIMMQYPSNATILMSPCFDKDWNQHIGSQLCEWIIRDGLINVRMQIQMHKIIGVR